MYSLKDESRRQSPLDQPHLGICRVCDSRFLTILHMSVNDHKNTEGIDFGVTSEF